MYLCLESDNTETWFEPQGRCLYEIATLYQLYNISIKFVNNKLLVKLYNIHKYAFSVGKKYYLFLEPDMMQNLQITLKFNLGDYIADMYYNCIDEIKPETWKVLRVRNIPECPVKEIDDNHWYAVDIEDTDSSDSEQSESSDEEYSVIQPEIEN